VRNAPDPQTDEKIGQIAQNQHLKTSFGNSGGSANVRIDISLGDPDGTKVSVTASGEIHDDKGNYVQAAITRDYDGPANVSISGGAKKESSGNDK
ncbi:MAG: hypothetical protein KGQ49_06945, partial [Verrucomicrobia bacterium]|nr:hypothetical protein [Verrucomicrobiota bacterium]